MPMNWNKIFPAVLGAAVLVGAGAAGANEGQAKIGEQAEMQTGQQQEVMLTVTNVDQANNKVQFEANLDPTAEVQKGTETIAVTDLQPGDQVRASFDPNTGEVQSLEVIEGGQQSPSMPTMPGETEQPAQEPGMEDPADLGGY